MSSELTKIEKLFQNKPDTIEKKLIDQWKTSSDIEVLGALVELITDPEYYPKIKPAMTFDDYYPFLFDYYIDCMQHDHAGEWVLSPYLAAYALKDLIEKIWTDASLPKKKHETIKHDIKKRLELLAVDADKNMKQVLINGLFEHLLDNKDIRYNFKDWLQKDSLKMFYECAIDKSLPIS